jgi:dTDP-4-amino-4,6-dideoxygalactose transaminase
VAEQARLIRSYGWRERYRSELHSTVSRLDEVQAAVLAAKLGHLDEWNATRRRLAKRYRDGLSGLVEVPPPEGVFHLFVVRTRQRDALSAHLTEHGVGTGVHYPLPAHLQSPYAAFGGGANSLRVTEQLAREVLSLPMYPQLSKEDVDYVCQIVRTYGA